MHPQTKEAYHLLHDGTLAFAKAERQGFRFDSVYADAQTAKLTKKINILEKLLQKSEFYKEWQRTSKSEININSGPQLASFLYTIKKIEPKVFTKKSEKGSTNEKALQALNIPELNMLLQIRKFKKLRDTFLGGFTKEQCNGWLHPFYDLSHVITYRSSSFNPNFQNIPKRDLIAMMITRNCLYPRLGNLLMEADYKQVEVGISACYHKDPTMLKYIKENGDMHKDVAIQIFGIKNFDKHIYGHKTLRKAAKNGFVFPQFYGDYYKPCAKSLACSWGNLPEGKWKKGQGIEFEDGVMLSDHMISLGINSLEKFTEHIRKIEKHFWEKRFPIYQKWKEDMWKKYQVKGYVDLFTGFRCGGLMDKKNVGNYPIQGAASHCLLWSFIRVTQLLEEKNMQTKLICQIHDALILDIYPPELEEVQKMVNYVMCVEVKEVWDWIIVPLAVEFDVGEIDKSWAYLGSD